MMGMAWVMMAVALQAPSDQSAAATPAVEEQVSPVPLRPLPVVRPWWGLGVSERAYRMVMPQGPSLGSLSAAEEERFWKVYAQMSQESLALDAAQLALLTAPVVLLALGAAVIPGLGLPGASGRVGLEGTRAQNLVGATLKFTPVLSLGVLAVAGLCGLGLVALTATDSQDHGTPPPPVKKTARGVAAMAQVQPGATQLILAGAVLAVSVTMAGAALALGLGAPMVLGLLLGETPAVMVLAYRTQFSGGGPVFGVGAVASLVAVCLLCAGVPVVMALGYAAPALAGVLGWEDGAYAAGDSRDVSTFLNPFNLLLNRRPPADPAGPSN